MYRSKQKKTRANPIMSNQQEELMGREMTGNTETKDLTTSKRLEVLKGSLAKKQKNVDDRFEAHFTDVRRANGQPINDKRNGVATRTRWDKQSDGIRNAINEVTKTENAIEGEEWKIKCVLEAKANIPQPILDLVDSGALTQWRKHPYMFFVPGVDKALIVWDSKRKKLCTRYLNDITDRDQWAVFAKVVNGLHSQIHPKQ